MYEINISNLNDLNVLKNEFKCSLDACETTKRAYISELDIYFKYLDDNKLDGTKPETVIGYKNHLINEGYKVSTVNGYLMAVKRFYAFLEESGKCQNVAKKVRKEKENKDFKKDSLTLEQCKSILCHIDTSTLTGKRNYALLMLLLNTGLRTIEVSRAQVGDIRNKGNATVLYVQGKGHTEKDSFVVLPESVQNALNMYFKARTGTIKDSSPLFECTGNRATNKPLHVKSISRIVKGIFKDNGLVSERLTAHSTRHTACTLALLNGANLQQVQQMARHQNINTTLIYTHNINRLQDAPEDKIADLLG